MHTIPEFLKKAEHNESFFASFDVGTTPYLDWAMTALFYAALHYLKAVLCHYHILISSYKQMDRCFERIASFKHNTKLHDCYRHLKDDSWEARYEARTFREQDIQARVPDFNYIKANSIALLRTLGVVKT